MADKDFEPEDPFQPVAVALATPGYDGMAAMARCFVEEYAVMGWPPERVFKLFTVPEFAASYSVYQEKGPDYIRDLISEVFGESFTEEPEQESIVLVPVNKRNQRAGALPREGDGNA